MLKFHKMVALDCTGISDFAHDTLADLCDTFVDCTDDPASDAAIVARAEGADAVLLSWRTHLSRQVLAALPDLRYIGLCCTLYEGSSSNVDLDAARERVIMVKGVRDYGDNGVGEFLFSELIRLVKGLGEQRLCEESLELNGMTLGIVGLGTVGRMVAAVGAAFGMDVRYHSRTRYADVAYPYMEIDELLSACSVISAHLPRHVVLLQQPQFSSLGSGKILMNTGLQPCYDETAFLRWIADPQNFAILDACAVGDPLRSDYAASPNIIIGRQGSGFTRNARKRLADAVVANAVAALAGQ